MTRCRLSNLLLSILGLTVIISPGGVLAQYDPTGIFINAGGSGFTDNDGNEWLPDVLFPELDRYPRYEKASAEISGSRDPELYTTERFNPYGSSMEIDIGGIQPGLYEVRLHFSEIYFSSVNKRIFDVWVQEVEIYNDLDIYALVGKNTALTINAATRVEEDENTIRIRLDRERQNPKINGIEIRPIVEVEEFSPIYINCGGAEAYRDSQDRVWSADEYFINENGRRSRRYQAPDDRSIALTNDDELYRKERFSTKELQYEIPGKDNYG